MLKLSCFFEGVQHVSVFCARNVVPAVGSACSIPRGFLTIVFCVVAVGAGVAAELRAPSRPVN